MSLWDFVAAASIATNINDKTSKSAKILKKINSASLSILNGDVLDYVGGGGRTYNTFGAVSTFTCDFEAVLEGWGGGATHNKTFHTFLGLVFGPGAVNNMTIGNTTELEYMPHHSQNFTFRRGGEPEEFCYYGKDGTSKVVIAAVLLFVLGILAFYLIYNFAGVFGKGISPVGDSGYIEDQEVKVHSKEKEIHALEASEHKQIAEQKQRDDAGYVLSPAELDARTKELHHTEGQLKEAENEVKVLESALKTAERQKEWLIYGNVIFENRGFLVIKVVEKCNSALVQGKNAVNALEKTVKVTKVKIRENSEAIKSIALLISTNDDDSAKSAFQDRSASLMIVKNLLESNSEIDKIELESSTSKLIIPELPTN